MPLAALGDFSTEEEEEARVDYDDIPVKRRNRHRDRGYALKEVENLSESEFMSMFRMSRNAFNGLLHLVSPTIVWLGN